MRFEHLRQRVERAERRVQSNLERAQRERTAFSAAWRAGWSPTRIVIAGLVSGFLVGRSEPLSKIGGSRWLQMLGTVSSMLASLRAAAASQDAGQSADAAAQQASVAADAASDDAPAAAHSIPATPSSYRPPDEPATRAPAPAEAATDVSER